MSSSPVDTSMAMSAAAQNDLVQRKMDMDALKKRLGDGRDEKQKLRESCEGFESIFVQKMWEQMRKTVPKGYLHSKDEETYQSLFDVELAKKMTEAGGIGLADMLYEQLSQQLEDTGRTTSPGSYRQPLEIGATQKQPATPAAPMQAGDLYSEMELGDALEAEPQVDIIAQALDELKTDMSRQDEASALFSGSGWEKMEYVAKVMGPQGEAEEAVTEAAEAAPVAPAEPKAAPAQPATAPKKVAAAAPEAGDEANERTVFSQSSWQSHANISVEPRPIPKHNRKAAKSTKPAPVASIDADTALAGRQATQVPAAQAAMPEAPVAAPERKPAATTSLGASQANWPVDGQTVSRFGWEDDPASGRRRWNSGVTIEAEAGDPVKACLDGEVVFAGERGNGEQLVILQHAGGYRSFYSNVEAGSLNLGDHVPGGAVFAKVASPKIAPGQKENSSPAYMGFELKRGEMALNPEAALKTDLLEAAG